MSQNGAASSEFAGKAVIVTGSSRGIGRETALAFARLGASVTIHGQSKEKLDETKELLKKEGLQEGQIASVIGPMQEESTVQQLVDKTLQAFGRIDILVNNAGTGAQQEQLKTPLSMENFDFVFGVNLRGVVQLTHLASPHLVKSKGCVVNVSSIAALIHSVDHMYYCMSKAALDHFTKDMANLLGKQGVRVNSVNPGIVLTDIISRNYSEEEGKKILDSFVNTNILKRAGTVDEIANLIVYLASSKAAFITGTTMVIDGGAVVRSEF